VWPEKATLRVPQREGRMLRPQLWVPQRELRVQPPRAGRQPGSVLVVRGREPEPGRTAPPEPERPAAGWDGCC
jgi:hypothetical protein